MTSSQEPSLAPSDHTVGTISREFNLDIAKGICILFVVLFHTTRSLVKSGDYRSNFYLDFFDNLAYSFHVQVFFILSGFFLVGRFGSYNSDLRKIFNLLYQYILWSVIYIVLSNLFSGQVNNKIPLYAILMILWHPILHMWFLLVLALCILLHANLRFVGKNLYLVVIIFSSFLSLIAAGWIHLLLYFIPFFFIGIVLKKRKISLNHRGNNTHYLCVISAILSIFGTFIATKSNSDIRSFPFYIISLSSCFFVISVSRLVSVNFLSKLISYIGQRSLPVYLAHVIFVSLAKAVLFHVSIKNFFLVTLGCCIAGIIGPLICFWFSHTFQIGKWLGFDPLLRSRRGSDD